MTHEDPRQAFSFTNLSIRSAVDYESTESEEEEVIDSFSNPHCMIKTCRMQFTDLGLSRCQIRDTTAVGCLAADFALFGENAEITVDCTLRGFI
jgi:hypothetical protein